MSDSFLCKDCVHSFRKISEFPNWFTGHEWLCRKSYISEKIEHNPVIGPIKQKGYYERCHLARSEHLRSLKEDGCGPEGYLWQPRNKKDLFKFIKHVSN